MIPSTVNTTPILHEASSIRDAALRVGNSGSREYPVYRAVGYRMAKGERSEPAREADNRTKCPTQLAYQSAAMNSLVGLAKSYARSSASVLVVGESGTGKEVFSRLLHEHSGRKEQPFVAVNCAAIPESLFESELFGHERGAFTGAVQKRRGYFEKADRGTLLLDEVSEIPLPMQAKLLRVIEEREVQPVGGDRPIEFDVRIIATSNQNLEAAVADGSFRRDLYHRLNVLELKLPPLRERVADIPKLVVYFLEMFCGESRHEEVSIAKGAMQKFCQHTWPGNVRELRNKVHRACVVNESGVITEACVESILPASQESEASTSELDSGGLAALPLAVVERKLILACLERFGGNKKLAAEVLGVTSRTLSNKLKLYRAEGYLDNE